ncbi:MAG: TldD/PmbA family protein [Thermoprotei archaeon]
MVFLEDIVKYAVEYALRQGVTFVEVRFENNVENNILLRNGTVDGIALTSTKGIGVRVLVDGALGFSSTNILNKENIRKTIRDAIKLARASAMTRKQPVKFSEEKTVKTTWNTPWNVSFTNISIEEKINLLQEIDKAIVSKEGEIKFPTRFISYSDKITAKYYVNSEGTEIRSEVPRIGIFYVISAFEPSRGVVQRTNQLGSSGGWESIKNWNVVGKVEEESLILKRILLESKPLKKQHMDVILGSEVVGLICHESSGHPSEADRILGREGAQAGESYISLDKIGTRIGSEYVTIIEDPTLPGSYGFYLYDDEGVQARRRYLIKEGIINELLTNRETAAILGTKSNGSARAMDYNYEPIIRMSNTFFQPGDYSFEELIEDVKFGIYVKNFMEWNIDDRRWNQRYVGLEAYIIENGEIKGLARNPVIEVTTQGLFSSVDAVGKELNFDAATCGKGDPMQGVPVWTGGPDIRVRDLLVGVRE